MRKQDTKQREEKIKGWIGVAREVVGFIRDALSLAKEAREESEARTTKAKSEVKK